MNVSRKYLGTKDVQIRLLDMATKIHEVFERNEIPYMIAFGTLLGAVRHGGFIPWDDDFDIFIFDDTYKCAMQCLKKELPNDMFVEDFDTEPLYFHAWPHVKDVNSIAVCEQYPQDNIYEHKGISIDLYIAHKMTEKKVPLFKLKENLAYQQRKHKIGLITEQQFKNIEEDLQARIDLEEEKTKNIFESRDAYGTSNDRILYPEEIFPLKKYTFENREFYGPQNSESILSRFYGDYMQLPQKEDRIPHYSTVEIL